MLEESPARFVQLLARPPTAYRPVRLRSAKLPAQRRPEVSQRRPIPAAVRRLPALYARPRSPC